MLYGAPPQVCIFALSVEKGQLQDIHYTTSLPGITLISFEYPFPITHLEDVF
jgi:hypothetical protein